ncbi:hypothetical protein XI03_00605 [Bradyrhizobium sp. CCBAU 65884]|nr:hypothetical protein [Bradyrhizobium sp. CCBAU 65884]
MQIRSRCPDAVKWSRLVSQDRIIGFQAFLGAGLLDQIDRSRKAIACAAATIVGFSSPRPNVSSMILPASSSARPMIEAIETCASIERV